MLQKILTAFVMLFFAASVVFAQVDVNKGDQAALDSIKGIGPKIAQTIVDERKAHGPFKDWADFEKRVKGVADKKATALSQAGLTVNGQSIANAPASSASAGKKDGAPVTSAAGTGKTGMQTDSEKNGGGATAVPQNSSTSLGKSSALPATPAKNGQPTSKAPIPAGTPGKKASMPMNSSASGDGKTGIRPEPARKNNAKEAYGFTQNAATSQGRLATPVASPTK